MRSVFIAALILLFTAPVLAEDCKKIPEAARQLVPLKEEFYRQLVDELMCAQSSAELLAKAKAVVEKSCENETVFTEDRSGDRLELSCIRLDRRSRRLGHKGSYIELIAMNGGIFRLHAAGQYYAGSRKMKYWVYADETGNPTRHEVYSVGVDYDNILILDEAGNVLNSGKARFSQLDDAYIRFGRWSQGKDRPEVVYGNGGDALEIDALKLRVVNENRPAPIAWNRRRMFYPVQDGKLLLPIACDRKQTYSWTGTAENFLQGLSSGDEVLIIDRAGDDVAGKLGGLVCFVGQCGQNILAVEIKADKPLKATHFAATQIAAPSKIRFTPESDAFQLVERDQDFYEMVVENSARYLGVAGHESGVKRVLKAQFEGICCPQATNFTEYEIAATGRDKKVVSTYATSGQPCD